MRVRPSSVEIDEEPSGTKTLDCVLGCCAEVVVLDSAVWAVLSAGDVVDGDEHPATETDTAHASNHRRSKVTKFSVPEKVFTQLKHGTVHGVVSVIPSKQRCPGPSIQTQPQLEC